jgi:hypothetical protein
MKLTLALILSGLLVVSVLTKNEDNTPMDQTKNKSDMKQELYTFLTFQRNDAEEAMNFYISLFENSRIIDLNRWGKEGSGN